MTYDPSRYAAEILKAAPVGYWTTFACTAVGGRVTLWVDGKKAEPCPTNR